MSRLAYHARGPAEAPPVILLHAIATSSALWEPQFATWEPQFRVIALDLPGHGRSAPMSGAPSISAIAKSVALRCETLEIAEAAFVGLSLGSMVLQRLAADRPDLVRAAVLANGVCAVPPAVADAWEARARAAETHGIDAVVEGTLERWFTPGFHAAAPMTIGRIADLVRRTSPVGFAYAARAIAALDQRENATRIACPTLILAGERDVAAPPEAVRMLADAVPGARFTLLDAPHLANVETAIPFTETVGAFLMEHCR